MYGTVPRECDEVASIQGDITNLLDNVTLHSRLKERAQDGRIAINIGDTHATISKYLVKDDEQIIKDDKQVNTKPSDQ